MKKLKKVIKEIPKKTMSFLLVAGILLSYVAPITRINATSYGNEGDNFINMGIDNNLGFNLNGATVNDNPWTDSMDLFHSENDQYHIVINVSKNEATENKIPAIQYGGNWNGYIQSSTVVDPENDNNYQFVLDLDLSGVSAEERNNYNGLYLSIIENQNNNNPGPENPNDPENPDEPGFEHNFDGKAYVIWSCGNGTCYHYFEDIPNFDDGNSTFYKASTIKADNDNSISFDIDAEYKAWTLPDSFNRWVAVYKAQNNLEDIDWSSVDPEDIIAEFPPDMRQWENAAVITNACQRPNRDDFEDEFDYFEAEGEFQACVDDYYIAAGNLPFIRLQPVNEPSANNAYVSYGDRNFKVVIYNDEFKGVTTGDLSILNYYPSSWVDPFTKRDQFDISGTTKENPTAIDSILLENTVYIEALNYNSFEMVSMEALDVPEDAVEITKVGNKFKLVFSSNFYDNVVFKITDSNGDESYIQVKRYTIDAYFRNDNNQRPVITAEFYFDRDKTYSDFDITLKIIYNDGTTKTVPMEAVFGIDDGLGNISDVYETDEENPEFGPAGKGLKKAVFQYALEDGEIDTISEAYVNGEYKGSTETNYAGAYVGSGHGVSVSIYRGGE